MDEKRSKMKMLIICGLIAVMALSSCRSVQPAETTAEELQPTKTESLVNVESKQQKNMRSPQVFVYKLKDEANYDRVPVTMNAARTEIESYPAPTDLKSGGTLRLPTRLVDGYLLDNKGIGPRVAFLSYTYEEYAALTEVPSVETLRQHIVDTSPLLTWRYYGRRSDYTDIVTQLNELIQSGS
jgi:hypothetical protein